MSSTLSCRLNGAASPSLALAAFGALVMVLHNLLKVDLARKQPLGRLPLELAHNPPNIECQRHACSPGGWRSEGQDRGDGEGKMDIGSVIYEAFATALDPYPKRQGASLQWQESDAQSDDKEKPEGPFAALAQLKQR